MIDVPPLFAGFVALLFGLLIGSFLNVCIFRLPNDYSVVGPRSYCPQCRRPIAWYDNIPVLSWFLLRGRCRQCRGRIRLRYPLVEAATGALFFTIFYRYGASLQALKLASFVALVIGLIVMDLEERVLPDEFTMGGLALGLVFAALVPFERGFVGLFLPHGWSVRLAAVVEAGIGAAVGGLVLWGVGVLYQRIRGREGLGGGDPRMVAMTGAFLGLHGALATVLIGSLLGSVVGLSYVAIARKDAATYELPFGTFLGVAALIVALIDPALPL
ncbi:MAG TPA: prepilin peptidase [Bryobacteraceae bacterium]|nr:prepilin peptidase [Bryobacteraceae bacterium]